MVVGVRDVVVVEVAGIVDGDVFDVTGGAGVPADSDAFVVEFAQADDATMIDNSKARVRMVFRITDQDECSTPACQNIVNPPERLRDGRRVTIRRGGAT